LCCVHSLLRISTRSGGGGDEGGEQNVYMPQ
jgi:hypothetical protein